MSEYTFSTWAESPSSIFWRFSKYSFPKFLIEAPDIQNATTILKSELKNFSEGWKIKKITSSGELAHNCFLKLKDDKYNELIAYKKTFSKFKIVREHFNAELEKHSLVFHYGNIEHFARLQTSIHFWEWLNGTKHLTIPQIVIYFANNGIKEYLVQDLCEADLNQLRG